MISHFKNSLYIFWGIALCPAFAAAMEPELQRMIKEARLNPFMTLSAPRPLPAVESFWQSMLKLSAHKAETAIFGAVATKIANAVSQPLVNGLGEQLQAETCNHLSCCGSWLSRRWLRFKLDRPILSSFLPKAGVCTLASAGIASAAYAENKPYKHSAFVAFPIIIAWKAYSLYKLCKRLWNNTFFIPHQERQAPNEARYCNPQSWPLSLYSFMIACSDTSIFHQTLRQHPCLLLYGSTTEQEKLNLMRYIAQRSDTPLFVVDTTHFDTMAEHEITAVIRLTINTAHNTIDCENRPCAMVCISNLSTLFSSKRSQQAIKRVIATEIEKNTSYGEDNRRVIMIGLDNNVTIAQPLFGELFYMHAQFNQDNAQAAASSDEPSYRFAVENDYFLNSLSERTRTLLDADKRAAQPQVSKEEASLLPPPAEFPTLESLPGVPRYLLNLVKEIQNPHIEEESVPRNILLWGNPGTGKSLMAVAFAKSAQLPAYVLNATKLVDSKLALNPETIFDLLGSRATRLTRPGVKRALLVLDECDILFKPLGTFADDSHAQRVSSQLRSLLSGLHAQSKNIMIIATCNGEPAKTLDPTLTRDERFHTIHITQPQSPEETKKVLAYDLQKFREFTDAERDEIANRLSEPAHGLSQAQLKDLLNSTKFDIDMDVSSHVTDFVREAIRQAREKKDKADDAETSAAARA